MGKPAEAVERSKLELDFESGAVDFDPRNGRIYTTTSWYPVDLDPVLNGLVVGPEPTYLRRTDGKALIYPGLPHVFFGASESLKSWAALLAADSFLADGLTVVYLDFEGDRIEFVKRCRKVGMPDAWIGEKLAYIRPEEPLGQMSRERKFVADPRASADLINTLDALKPSLIVIDGVSEAYAMHGWDINRAEDAVHFQHVFGRWEGAASIAIDHAGKDAERGMIGSQHKRAGLNGAAYEFTSIRREGEGGLSVARIKVSKDRHGQVRSFTPKGDIGLMLVGERVLIKAPDEVEGDAEAQQVAAVAEWIEANPGQSSTAIIKSVGVKKSRGLAILDQLEAEGYIEFKIGPRKAQLWTSAKRYSDEAA